MSEVKQAPRWIAGVEPTREVLAMDGTQVLEMECRQQPEKLRELLSAYKTDATIRAEMKKLRELAAAKSGPVLFLGMGGSLCASLSASAWLTAEGRSSFAIDAGEWLHYATKTWDEPALTVLVTTSGESAELVKLFEIAGDRPTALVCNNPESKCWKIAKHKLPILAGPEYGNATKTYTNSTAAGILLAKEILGETWESEFAAVIESYARDLDPVFAMRGQLEEFTRGAANIEVIGRGPGYGAAFMGALTIREMSGFRAAVHTGAGFKHGPNLDTDATHVAMIFALGRAADLGVKLAAECNKKGGRVVLVSNEEHARTEKLFPVRLEKVPEPWEGITALLVPQALTLAMIERNGCKLPPRFAYGVMEQ